MIAKKQLKYLFQQTFLENPKSEENVKRTLILRILERDRESVLLGDGNFKIRA